MQRQFIYTVPEKVFSDKSLTINDLKIYMTVRSFMDTTGDAYPSNNWIAERLEIDRTTAIRSLNRLCDKGYLVRETIDGHRHLRIALLKIPERVVAATPPPGGTDATPPGGTDATQLIQTIITSKSIKSRSAPNFNKTECPKAQSLMSDEASSIIKSKKLDEPMVISSFIAYAKAKAWQLNDWKAAFIKWVIDQKTPFISENNYKKALNEPRCTVKEWGPGHPSWDSLHGKSGS